MLQLDKPGARHKRVLELVADTKLNQSPTNSKTRLCAALGFVYELQKVIKWKN